MVYLSVEKRVVSESRDPLAPQSSTLASVIASNTQPFADPSRNKADRMRTHDAWVGIRSRPRGAKGARSTHQRATWCLVGMASSTASSADHRPFVRSIPKHHR